MKRFLALALSLCLLLTGCGWMDGNYYSVTPHQQSADGSDGRQVTAKNYLQLRIALEKMVSSGTENMVINLEDYSGDQLENSMDMAIRYIKSTYPIGSYAVEDVRYELGTSGGAEAVAVEVRYLHSRMEIHQIRKAENMDQVNGLIGEALENFDTSLVVLVDLYEPEDIQQLVEDYAAMFPSIVMEVPRVTVQTYPDTGNERVLELKFGYQTNRDNLRSMREQVQRFFDSAALYVSSNATDIRKFSQLYSFLMERFYDFQVKTALTPAYSLINYGVGDSHAFATVYAEMCRRVGLECMTVVGTWGGVPWCWNIVRSGGKYYHVDLLASRASGYTQLGDSQMEDYVWDYSAYPACEHRGPGYAGGATEPTEPEDTTEPTVPPTESPVEPTDPPTEPTVPPTDPPDDPTVPPTEPPDDPTIPPTQPPESETVPPVDPPNES